MVLGAAGFGLSELLLAPVTSMPLASILLFLAGISFTTWASTSNSLIQLAAPDYLRGRLIGVYFFAFAGSGTAGGILAGWLTAAGGTELAFAVGGIAGLATSAIVYVRSRALALGTESATHGSKLAA